MSRQQIRTLLLAVIGLALVVAPAASLGSSAGGGASSAGRPSLTGPLAGAPGDAAGATMQRAKKRRCRVMRSKHGARKRRVCKKRPSSAPLTRPPLQPASPSAPARPQAPASGPAGAPQPVYENPEGPPPGPQLETVDLITNNDFEEDAEPTACFEPFSPNQGSVASTTTNPIAGAKSLAVQLTNFGKVACIHEYGEEGPIGKTVTIDGKLQIDSPPGGNAELNVCAVVYFKGTDQDEKKCRTFTPQDQGTLQVHVVKEIEDSGAEPRHLRRVFFQLEATSNPVEATLDDVHMLVEQVRGSAGGGPGGGGGGGGGGGSACGKAITDGDEPAPDGPPAPDSPCNLNATPRPDSSYTPASLTLRQQRPFISLADYTQAPANGAIFQAFKRWVDQAVFQHIPNNDYSSTDAVIMFARTGNAAYIDDAIARMDATVTAAEEAIAANRQPGIAGDNYLDVGAVIEELALTYDYGFSRLTPQQRARWEAYGDQAVANVWSPLTATWGDKPAGSFPWSAWAINDPGNNYNYSFVEATQMWGLARQDQRWLDFLQDFKFPLIVDYHAGLPGGGSREGTGYGTAQRRLWENARMWRASTGEDLTTIRTHARESIDYWVHATVPTLDHYAPVGDLSRQSLPTLFDYHENLVREAVMAAPGTEQGRLGVWWLANNSVPETLTAGFTLRGALLLPTDVAQAPTPLTYRAPGVGQFFARSSWSRDATWLQLTAGPYDQSHAHEDQGGFTLYRNTWLAVTSNIWTHSGLQGGGGGGTVGDLDTGVNNVIRFTRPGQSGAPPQTIRQNFGDPTVNVENLPGNLVKVHTDLDDVYSNNDDEVHGWTRDLEFQSNTLRVHDTCQVAPGIGAVFQLHVPVQPVNNGGGTITAGKLRVETGPAAGVNLVDMQSFNPSPAPGDEEFQNGWRIDITNPNGCAFDVDLTALP
jgi:hypothetical protein